MKTNGPCTQPTRIARRAADTAASPTSAPAVATFGWVRAAADSAVRLHHMPSERSAGSSGDLASLSVRTDLPVHERSVTPAAEGLLPRRRGRGRSHGWRGSAYLGVAGGASSHR